MPLEQSDKIPWSKGTVLIMGDSTHNGMQERLMGPGFKERLMGPRFKERLMGPRFKERLMGPRFKERLMGPRFKVRAFPRGIVGDFYHNALPLLEKKPTYVILMAGTNDSLTKTSEAILVELLKLKTSIEDSLPGCKVIISNPTYRYDEPKICLTVLHLRKKLSNLETPHILNDNIKDGHIGKRGLHLNARGSGRLAVNFYMRQH